MTDVERAKLAWSRGIALFAAGRKREAIDDLQRAAEGLEPKDARMASFYLSDALASEGRIDDAIRAHDASLAARPSPVKPR